MLRQLLVSLQLGWNDFVARLGHELHLRLVGEQQERMEGVRKQKGGEKSSGKQEERKTARNKREIVAICGAKRKQKQYLGPAQWPYTHS